MVEFYFWMSVFSFPGLLVGLLVRRWWAILLAIGIYVLVSLVFPHLYSESYKNSSDFNSAVDYSFFLMVVFALPAAVALSLGVVVRRVVRWMASADD